MDPTDPRSWFGPDGNYPYQNPPNSSSSTPPIHVPTPTRPDGFMPYATGVHGFSPAGGFQAAHTPTPLFSSPFAPPRQTHSPISRMSSFEDYSVCGGSSGSSPRTVVSLADESEPPADELNVVEVPIREARGGRRGARGGRARGGRGRGRRGGRSSQAEDVEGPVGEGAEGDDEDGGSHQYSAEETKCLARVWVDTTHDARRGNNQRAPALWHRIAERYNDIKPQGKPKRTSEKLRNHWKRVMADIKLFESSYNQCADALGSGKGQAEIITDALNQFHELTEKAFKYFNTWEMVRGTPKFLAASGSVDAVKRCKTSIDGSFSTESSRESNASEEMTMSFDGSQGYRPRPEGSKAAKARAKGKSKLSDSDDGQSVSAAEGLAALADSLQFKDMYEVYTKKTDDMDPETLKLHRDVIAVIRKKLGIPPPSED